jgi:SAM-dependent methyltransferase
MDYQGVIHKQKHFENQLDVSHRKDYGVFLTNNISTIDKILSNIDFNDRDILKKKFLEPSCGNGVFILRLLENVFQNGISISQAIEFIETSIFFVDIQEEMIQETKINISNYFKNRFDVEYVGKYNGFIYDFTNRLKPKCDNTLFEEIMDFPLKNYLDKIDYVFGNPPYVSLYGRRDRKKDEAQRVYYLNRYSQFPDSLKNGKINYVMLFIEQAIDFLKPGGIVSFIIDLAFFETAYEHTRKFLLTNTKIISIEINITDFDVTSGQIILSVQKERVKEYEVKIIDSRTNRVILVNQSKWFNPNDQYKFRFNNCSVNQNIVEKIQYKKLPTLKDLYPKKNLRTCVMLLNMENLFVFDKEDKSFCDKIYPYYQGSKGLSKKYDALKSTKYFHYNKQLQGNINDELKEYLAKQGIKNKKRIGLGETIIYDNPKVYIRQSAKEIIATYDDKPSSANNSLYVFSLRGNNEEDIKFLKFLCGFLNSELVTFYAQQQNIIRYSKGKQPQIKTSDLYALPIIENADIREEITEIVDDIYSCRNIKENMSKIDSIVYENFGIDNDEVQKIKRSIESF